MSATVNAAVSQPVKVIGHGGRSDVLQLAGVAGKLRRAIEGEVLFDRASRGRYSTDASIYQIEPLGVVVPRTEDDALAALTIARDEGLPVLARGGGTSQCGQTVGAALVIDNSRWLRDVTHYEPGSRRIEVQPGLVLDQLNEKLKPHGLWFPVDVSTSAQATLGGMAGNNSCGSRSIAYGNMVHNVAAIEAVLADGTTAWFDEFDPLRLEDLTGPARYCDLVGSFVALAQREAGEIAARFPPLLRRVAGYNLDLLAPRDPRGYDTVRPNMAHLLVGSEGTLAYFRRLRLKLSPLPAQRVLGVVSFPTFHQSMALTQHIVPLGPTAVELVDRTMIDLARVNPAFRPTIERALVGEPQAILLVEFAGDEHATLLTKLDDLSTLMADLGLPGSVVRMPEAGAQKALWEVRKAGLNIMMSMKGDGKPVSFIEDCCVPLEHLAEYTQALTAVFERHGTRGTWYAHASVGTLHVRPVLNMKADGAHKLRAIAEEACELVKRYKGVYSGEHGDGLVRSEWIAPFFGPRLTACLGEIKGWFDPDNRMNPGKIVAPSKQDDRRLMRFASGYAASPLVPALDWSAALAPGQTDVTGGLLAAVEMCNNNGHCRKFDAGTMCPSYRVTRDERDLTRGRANTLRLALTGQLGPDALTSDAMAETMALCVGCKGCRRECPTGVDMAKLKTEFLHHYTRRHGMRLFDRMVAYLPRYAHWAARLPWLANLRETVPGARRLAQAMVGLAADRKLPRWRRDTFWRAPQPPAAGTREVVLLVDTFNGYWEPENAFAALAVLRAAGFHVHLPRSADGPRPLCCGRTFLAAGLVDEARAEARRMHEALQAFAERGVPIVGLEPSCLLTLRDEHLSLHLGEAAHTIAAQAMLFEEFLARESRAGRLDLKLRALPQKTALLHGHCHQKAFDAVRPIQEVLALVPGLKTELIESSCCGMAGTFGYHAENGAVSRAMGEAALLPRVRAAAADTLIVADGTSCRHQIGELAPRQAVHVARVLHAALAQH